MGHRKRVPEPEHVLGLAVAKLTGLPPDDVASARQRVREFGIPHVTHEMCAPNVDAAVGAFLLVDSIDGLTARGIDLSKLLSKLRGDRDVWPTWAELRAARHLAEFLEDEGELELEPDRHAGRHSDFRFKRTAGNVFRFLPTASGAAVSVEFKAVGLSDSETAFCQDARPLLERLRPPRGFVTVHAPLELPEPKLDAGAIQHGEREAIRLAASLPSHTDKLSGATVVGHGSESEYVRRIRLRLLEAFAQLPPSDECWIALHWSNGAPTESVQAALPEMDLPSNLAGIVLVGSAVAFPHAEIHHFLNWALADYQATDERAVHSAVDDELARLVLERIEDSSGVRASIIRYGMGGNAVDVLVRDGSRRILPFILLIDRDPSRETHGLVRLPGDTSPPRSGEDLGIQMRRGDPRPMEDIGPNSPYRRA